MAVHLARGTRDVLPEQAHKQQWVLDRLRAVMERHAFDPLQTPAIERIETLTGNYGEEGQKLMFRILKRGEGAERGECDLALRYDLTVPLARVIAMNPSLRLPFRRWQAAPVWRAERPAKGRYREFWQFDADIAGTTSPMADAEAMAVATDCLSTLGFQDYVLRVNDRRILRAMARVVSPDAERESDVLIALDKLDKIGRDGVSKELASRGFDDDGIQRLWVIIDDVSRASDPLSAVESALSSSNEALAGVASLRTILPLAEDLGVPAEQMRFDITLARGLDYYTGVVFEVGVASANVGSIAGGGRYDGLVGRFSKNHVPAVGISLGVARVIDVMEELGLLDQAPPRADVLVSLWDEKGQRQAARIAARLRDAGLKADLVLDPIKLGAQFKRADHAGIRWVIVVGPDEVEKDLVAIKDLKNGQQRSVSLEDAVGIVCASRDVAAEM